MRVGEGKKVSRINQVAKAFSSFWWKKLGVGSLWRSKKKDGIIDLPKIQLGISLFF